MVVGKFKKEYIEIPIIDQNTVLKKSIWEKKKNLRGLPFWFSGFTVYLGETIKITGIKFYKFIF